MTPFAWILGLILPACGAAGAGGLLRPVPLDVTHIERPDRPNTALAAPAGFHPVPDVETRVYDVSVSRLYDAIRAVAHDEPRTFPAAEFPDRHQADYVVRSAVFNFPDLVTVVALDPAAQSVAGGRSPEQAETGSSSLIIWSRSVYGRSDLGVNRARILTWLKALDRRLAGA